MVELFIYLLPAALGLVSRRRLLRRAPRTIVI